MERHLPIEAWAIMGLKHKHVLTSMSHVARAEGPSHLLLPVVLVCISPKLAVA